MLRLLDGLLESKDYGHNNRIFYIPSTASHTG